MDHWPWWASAIALATIGFAYYRFTGIRMGVSGLMARVTIWRAERQKDRTEAAWKADPSALEAALLAATQKLAEQKQKALARSTDASDAAQPAAPAAPPTTMRLPVTAGLTFMIMLVVGGLLGSLVRTHTWQVKHSLGSTWESFFGNGAAAWGVLLAGGLLVGIGTRMAGGCTSGHGLSGCSRLQPGSLLATAAFFGTGIAVSFLLASMWRMS